MAYKVKIGEAEHEVEALDGWLPEERVRAEYMPKTTFEAELGKRTKSIIKNDGYRKAEELLEDEGFKKTFIEKHGLDPSKSAQEFQAALVREKEGLIAREVTPLKERLTKYEQRIAAKNARELQSTILSAAAGKVKPSLLKGTNGTKAPIVAMLESVFGHDEENDAWFVRKGDDGYMFSKSGVAPYQTVEEFIDEWAQNKDNADWLVDQTQAGPEANIGKKHAVTGNVKISRADAQDPAKYRRAREEATKRGFHAPEIVG